jgi:hypothetical protein
MFDMVPARTSSTDPFAGQWDSSTAESGQSVELWGAPASHDGVGSAAVVKGRQR